MWKHIKWLLYKVFVFSFCHTILLWCVWTRKLMNDTLCWAIFIESIGGKLSITICPRNLYFMIKYIFYCGFEILKNIKDIRFEFEQVKPSEFSKVINKYQILFVIINRIDKSRALYITANKFKRSRWLKNRILERLLTHFTTKTMFAVCNNWVFIKYNIWTGRFIGNKWTQSRVKYIITGVA